MIDIHIPNDETLFTSSQYNVKGVFCALEWGKQKEDPSVMFKQLCAIQGEYAGVVSIDDDELVAIAMSKAPEMHKDILVTEQRRIAKDASGASMTLISLPSICTK